MKVKTVNRIIGLSPPFEARRSRYERNSLLAAARSREVDEGDGPRCCGRGFFAYFLFPKKVGGMAVFSALFQKFKYEVI